jgi:hypothetical protein
LKNDEEDHLKYIIIQYPMFGGNNDNVRRTERPIRMGQCPCCQKSNADLVNTIGRRGIALAICAHRPISQQLTAEFLGDIFDFKCFAACRSCWRFCNIAIASAREQLNNEIELL